MTRLLAAPALFALALGVLTPPARPAAAADDPKPAVDFFFKPGDRVVFLGDSITEQYQYSTYIELYLTTRFPEAKFTFLNAGIGGDTANGGANRFKAHVLDEKPTAVTINFGMNDGGYGAFNPNANKTYVEKTEAMIEMAKKAGVWVALVSPNAVETRTKPNLKQYLETQKEFYAPLRGVAAKFGVPFVDQYAVTRAALERMEKDDPTAKKVNPFPDGVHTSSAGGLLMAHTILTGLHAPARVSDAVINVTKTGATWVNLGCKITDGNTLTPTGGTFTRTDVALPMPVQKDWLSMLPYTNDLKDLNYYGLKVSGLQDGDYTVSIDGVEVGKYSAKQLFDGVNLGLATTGLVWEQGNKVLAAINDKNNMIHGRFRGILLGGDQYWNTTAGQKRRAEELARRLEEATAAQAEIDKLAKPVARKFEIKPAK